MCSEQILDARRDEQCRTVSRWGRLDAEIRSIGCVSDGREDTEINR